MTVVATAEPRSVASTGCALKFLWLEVTGKCNLRCVHCYADSGPDRRLDEYMSTEDWENVLEEAADLGCRAVQFIGGEPTMYPALPSLIEHARSNGFTFVEVYTNGTMLKSHVKEAFVRHKVNLAFSVYSSGSRIHDSITQQQGSHDCTLESIRWALDSHLSVRAGVIEMTANAGETERTRESLQKIGVSTIGVDRMRGVGRGGEKVAVDSQLEELCGSCTQGRLAVTATGDIFPCVFSRFWPVGHVRNGLRAAVEGASLRAFKASMHKNGSSRSHSETGTSCKPEPCVPDVEEGICEPDFVRDPQPEPEPEPPPVCDPDFAPEKF